MARPRSATPNYRLEDRNGVLYARWWEDGAWQRISTGTANRREAEQFLAQLIAGRGTPLPPEQPTIAKIIGGYLEDRKSAVRAYATLEACAKPLIRHLGDLEPSHITKERCRFYLARRRAEGYMVGPPDARRKKPVQDGTVIRELIMLRSAFSWAVKAKWIAEADKPYIEVPHSPPPRERWLTPEEAQRLLDAALAPHVRLFLTIALFTAARAGAILELTWDRVDLQTGLIDFGPVPGGKGRAVVPTNDLLLEALKEARTIATCRWVIEYGSKPVNKVKRGTEAAARRAGLPGVTPHILRHTAATWMVMGGVPMGQIAKFLGHSDSRITEKTYAKYAPDYLRGAANVLGNKITGALRR